MSSSEQERLVQNQTFTQPYHPTENVIQDPIVLVFQEPYLMTRADFLVLTTQESKISAISGLTLAFFGAFIAFFIPVLGKYLSSLMSGNPSNIELWELIAVAVAFVLTITTFVIVKKLPSERKKFIDKMKKHFEEAPRSIEVRRRSQ